MTAVTASLAPLQRYGLMALAVVQGLLLFALHEAHEHALWPATQLPWLYAAYAVCVTGPVWLTLLFGSVSVRRLLLSSSAFLMTVAIMSGCAANQLLPLHHVRDGTVTLQLILSILLLAFIALTLVHTGLQRSFQHACQRVDVGWHHALLMGCAGLFTLAVLALLLLWAALFEAIGIDWFDWLFSETWFLFPALALANAVAILLLRERETVFTALGHLHTSLMRLLLPLVAGISCIFASALPFTGLDALWDNGGSTLLLWLQALMLFLLNSVYLSHARTPYTTTLQRLVVVALLIMPLFSVISAYGLSMRILQHGFSVARLWGVIVWAVLALLAFGYAVCWLRWRARWEQHIGGLNLLAAGSVMAILLAIHTPLADLRQWSVDDQLARWQHGLVTDEQLDLDYFEYDLARPGFIAMQQLQQEVATSHPALALRLAQRLHRDEEQRLTTELLRQGIDGAQQAPEQLLQTLLKELSADRWRQTANSSWLRSLDANQDGELEYLLVQRHRHYQQLTLYAWQQGQWTRHPLLENNQAPPADLIDPQDSIEVVPPKWSDVQIGDQRFRVGE
ncbi:hypothetical protein CHH28_10155 [Bacterioplanes sanyensis]|uniref:DUF4153 domain-containing protein n=1 Tax=Bacterioplanes sanyensis TaxID=1249553 RepID=A0A222FIZ8_9GAMM|nr:DUF4153 domain-containing protein [Bacterioplanes sanyensis]ASP39017.1 hypothetical protein CHH28_10155 [Bacterioplanes sanyensis]